MELNYDEGTHEIDGEFIYNNEKYFIELIITNTETEADTDEYGNSMPHTVEGTSEIELLQAFKGEELDQQVVNEKTLQELEAELWNY